MTKYTRLKLIESTATKIQSVLNADLIEFEEESNQVNMVEEGFIETLFETMVEVFSLATNDEIMREFIFISRINFVNSAMQKGLNVPYFSYDYGVEEFLYCLASTDLYDPKIDFKATNISGEIKKIEPMGFGYFDRKEFLLFLEIANAEIAVAQEPLFDGGVKENIEILKKDYMSL